ncbi:MAG: hypothetical protein LH478_13825 [Chitinophagaceae bacterium]|nr:hypothetical protein [Chitinophagaceae bacterium]
MKTTFGFCRSQQSFFGWFKIVITLPIIALVAIQCKPKTSRTGKEPTPGGSDSSQYLYRLRLPVTDYDTLKAYGGDGLVLQFFYPASGNCSSPTLYAYAMKTGHQSVGKPPIQLQYDSITTEPFRGRSQVLGDQSVRYDSIDNVLGLVPGGYANKNYYLVFTPKFYPGNPHVYYEIQVSGSGLTPTRPTKSDPSPPYSSF